MFCGIWAMAKPAVKQAMTLRAQGRSSVAAE